MKKIALCALLFTATAFAEEFVLDNQTAYPEKNQKIAIELASSAKEVDASNKVLIHGGNFNSDSLQNLAQKGKITLTIPQKAAYFRVIAWSKEEETPDFSTNWIDIVPDKTYILEPGHLAPIVLMSGMGC